MHIIIADKELTCNKCWFNTIQPGEPCITDAPLLKYDGSREDLEIRHWHLTRPDHPDSCYEREIRTSTPSDELVAQDWICAHCNHPITKGQEIYTEKLWVHHEGVSKDSVCLTDEDGKRILDENGNPLQYIPFGFHKECPNCNSDLSCLQAFARSISTEINPDELQELQDKPESESNTDDEIESDANDRTEFDTDDKTVKIAEKVRFWEEQDRINQELIPRVIRQNELLTQHIAEHDNLQQIFSDTIQKALAEQAQQYESALDTAKKQLNETHEQITQKALSEQTQQYESALDTTQKQLNETYTKALEALRQEARQTQNWLTAIAAGSAIIAIAALIVTVLI